MHTGYRMDQMEIDPLDEEAVVETRESVERKLALLEAELAVALGIEGDATRRELVIRVRTGSIAETAPGISEWLALYSAVMEWVEQPDHPLGPGPEQQQTAAESGRFVIALAA